MSMFALLAVALVAARIDPLQQATINLSVNNKVNAQGQPLANQPQTP